MFKINDKGFIRPIKPFPPRAIMSDQEALKKSVLKWRFIYDHINDIKRVGGWMSCALCHLYMPWQCSGCPIFRETGERVCLKTPYSEANELFDKYKVGDASEEEALDAIQKMIDYLERFLD